MLGYVLWIKATLAYRCSKFINRLRESKSRFQTKTERNTSTLKGKQQEHQSATKTNANIHRKELFDTEYLSSRSLYLPVNFFRIKMTRCLWHTPDLSNFC